MVRGQGAGGQGRELQRDWRRELSWPDDVYGQKLELPVR